MVIKSKRLRYEGHMACNEKNEDLYQIFIEEPEETSTDRRIILKRMQVCNLNSNGSQ
jgi:hypothetical protein